MKTIKFLSIAIIGLILFACTDDSDDSVKPGITISPNEEELITTVELHFSDTNQMALDTVSFNDPDGDGGMAPSIDTLRLSANQVYVVNALFLDKSNPADIEDITAEILAEDDEHIICYETNNTSGITINRTDSDGSYEVGLSSRWELSAGAISTNGAIKLVLKHQPGIKDGTCNPGDTDVEVSFPLIVQ